MKLIIARHGRTVENETRIFQGHSHGKLTEKGVEQAKKLATRLKNEKIDTIFASDLKRAVDTAKEIAKFHTDIPFEFSNELRERYLGKLQGKSKDKIKGWGDEKQKDLICKIAGAEPTDEFMNRAKNIVEKILQNNPNKNILIVAHGAINAAIIANLLNNRNLSGIPLIVLKVVLSGPRCAHIFPFLINFSNKEFVILIPFLLIKANIPHILKIDLFYV